MRVISDSGRILAHWVYTKEEWRAFQQWERRRQGWWRYLLSHLRVSQQAAQLPEVLISGKQITINQQPEVFQDSDKRLKRVHVRESGSINVLEIYYQQKNGSLRNICLPVPKGRLREAMEVQESLSGYAC